MSTMTFSPSERGYFAGGALQQDRLAIDVMNPLLGIADNDRLMLNRVRLRGRPFWT
jgi:hypothetical protein